MPTSPLNKPQNTPTETPFRGTWPALLTPLNADLSINHARFAAHANALLAAGCGGVTAFGTTGEGTSFSVAERIAAVEALVAAGVPAQCIIVGTTAAALPDAVALTRHATAIGAHGSLLLQPFYYKGLSDAGVIDYFAQVIDQVAEQLGNHSLRLYLYHIPQIAGVGLTHGVIAALKARYPQVIVGIKDSAGDLAHSLALADAFMPGVRVYVGHELHLPTLARRGSTGAISGLANLLPRTVTALVEQADSPETDARLARVADLLNRLRPFGAFAANKGVMALHSGDTGWLRVRPPLQALDSAGLAQLKAALEGFHFDPATD